MDGNTRDPFDDLDEAVDRDVVTWDHETEPKIAGQVVEIGSVTTRYGTSPTVDVLTKDGRQVQIPGFGAVRKRQLSSGIDVGDLLAMRYLGKVQGKSGQKPYDDFRTVVRNADGSPKARSNGEAAEPEMATEEPYGFADAF
jgi:hypothetical protein